MKKLLAAGVALLFAQHATANPDLAKIENLFNSGNSLEAYNYATSLQAKYEGIPSFDYYFGAAAIDTGNASQGVFALERVLIQEPNNNAARLELARGYFQLEELARSRQEFEKVLKEEPPRSVREKIEQYLNAIRLKETRYLTSAQTTFRIGVGSDDNVNVATDKTSYFIPGISAPSPNNDPNSLSQDSFVNEIDATINLNFPISSRFTAFGGTQIQAITNTDASRFNNQSLIMNAGLKHRTGQHLFTYQGFHQAYILDSDFYRNRGGFNFQYQYQLSQKSLMQLFAQLSQSDHVNTSNQDTELHLFGANYIRQLNYKFAPTISASIYSGKERIMKNNSLTQALDSYFGRDFIGISTSLQLQTSHRGSLNTSISYQDSEAPELFFAGLSLNQQPTEAREDKLTTFNIKYSYLLSQFWKTELSVTTTKNDSNIGLFEYDKNRFMLNFIFSK